MLITLRTSCTGAGERNGRKSSSLPHAPARRRSPPAARPAGSSFPARGSHLASIAPFINVRRTNCNMLGPASGACGPPSTTLASSHPARLPFGACSSAAGTQRRSHQQQRRWRQQRRSPVAAAAGDGRAAPAGLVAAGPAGPAPDYAAIDAQPLNRLVYSLFRGRMVQAIGADSTLKGCAAEAHWRQRRWGVGRHSAACDCPMLPAPQALQPALQPASPSRPPCCPPAQVSRHHRPHTAPERHARRPARHARGHRRHPALALPVLAAARLCRHVLTAHARPVLPGAPPGLHGHVYVWCCSTCARPAHERQPTSLATPLAPCRPLPATQLNAWATWLTCQWLMGECQVNDVEVDGGRVAAGHGVLVKRCAAGGQLAPR